MYSIESVRQVIEDAQNLLVRAMGELEQAKEMTKNWPDGEKMFSAIHREWLAVAATDDRLGDIRTGHNQ